MSVYFILCCARSGSTSLARILDGASNGVCRVEPEPNLNRETRRAMDGRLERPARVVRDLLGPRVRDGLDESKVYGEKNVTYGPFVRELRDAFDARFVLLHRDGRDVVDSLVNWHEQLFGNVYRECRDPGRLASTARSAVSALPVWLDTSDYARPRPGPGDRWYGAWESFSRRDMCAYYWARVNALYLGALSGLPRSAWIRVDYTHPTAADVLAVADFLGLKGLAADDVQARLESRINSLADRGAGEGSAGPWMNWTGRERERFTTIAGDAMERLGYWTDPATRWRPPDYGRWWCTHDAGPDWYQWMYDSRRRMHEECVGWIRARREEGEPIESVADFGCGLGVGYCDDLADLRYLGVDIDQRSVDWCRQHRNNPKHAYECRDFISDPLPQRYDLVMSSGTVDNVYDVDAFLAAMIKASRGWIYLTAYRGWFPELDAHRYTWSEEHQCFYTDVSPTALESTLTRLGCTEVTVEPRATDRGDIPAETRVTARVPPRERQDHLRRWWQRLQRRMTGLGERHEEHVA